VERSAALKLIADPLAKINLGHPVRVAIDGRDGAGKTSLGDELREALGAYSREVIRASVDGFHNPKRVRYARGRSSPEGYFRDSFNYTGFRENLLLPLGPDGSLQYRTQIFDYRTDADAVLPVKRAAPAAIALIDGIFLLRTELVDLWDVTIYVDVSVEVSMLRTAGRDGGSPDPDHESNRRYVEGQEIYLRECNPQLMADIVLNNDDIANPRIVRNRSLEGIEGRRAGHDASPTR
jgi:uridine kinase